MFCFAYLLLKKTKKNHANHLIVTELSLLEVFGNLARLLRCIFTERFGHLLNFLGGARMLVLGTCVNKKEVPSPKYKDSGMFVCGAAGCFQSRSNLNGNCDLFSAAAAAVAAFKRSAPPARLFSPVKLESPSLRPGAGHSRFSWHAATLSRRLKQTEN